ncbi:STAS domain-containing protein [Streptomyces sp. NPDC047028]|uniref:STAS domain-containing protein n=1 Tax=Streptomyces sp. NPDC047028 TaxID=3155793 RepID=UPI0033FF50E9
MPMTPGQEGGPLMPEQATGQATEQITEPATEQAAMSEYAVHGAWVVVARGDYDMHTIAPLAKALEDGAGTRPKVILDASGVTFADSTFLNLLIRAHHSGTLRLVAPSPQVRRLCEITGADAVLEIRGTVDEAASS